jgi:hypothetical protein
MIRSTANRQGMEARWIRDAALSTIPVLLTLHIFSAAQKSSRSICSLKIMIRLALKNPFRSESTRFTHLFDCVLRD